MIAFCSLSITLHFFTVLSWNTLYFLIGFPGKSIKGYLVGVYLH